MSLSPKSAIRKLYRVAVVAPVLQLSDVDKAVEPEAQALMWLATIDALARHPRLAVLPAQTQGANMIGAHLVPAAGHTDQDLRSLFDEQRRDEVVWLELPLDGQAGAVRLHIARSDGSRRSHDMIVGAGRPLPVDAVIKAWLSELGFEPDLTIEVLTAAETVAAARALAETFAASAEARAATARAAPSTLEVVASEDETAESKNDQDGNEEPEEDSDDSDEDGDSDEDDSDEDDSDEEAAEAAVDPVGKSAVSVAGLAEKLAPQLKAAAIQALGLAGYDHAVSVLATVDAEHPLVLAPSRNDHDPAALRHAIATTPGNAAPYLRFIHDENNTEPGAPTALEDFGAAGLAAFLSPATRTVAANAANRFDDLGVVELGLRLAERAVNRDSNFSFTHQTLLDLFPQTERLGLWLDRAHRASWLHGCPMDSPFPWWPYQINIDLAVSMSLMHVGRLDEGIALRHNRIEGREQDWPRQAKVLTLWRKDPRFVAWCYAREGHFRGEDGRVVEGFGRIEPADGVDLAMFIDSLVATGREHEVPLAWAHYGLGRRFSTPASQLAAGRGLFAAGQWRDGAELLLRVQLGAPLEDHHVAVAHALRLLSAAPREPLEAAISDFLDAGAVTLAKRLARDFADFADVSESEAITDALDLGTEHAFDPAWLASFPADTRSRAAIDELFASTSTPDELVNRWYQVVFVGASNEDQPGLAEALAYMTAQALGRYLAATTSAPTPYNGALRTVAAEALAALRPLAHELTDRALLRLLAALDVIVGAVAETDPVLVEGWVGYLERSLQLDERTDGHLSSLTKHTPHLAELLFGPEDLAVTAWQAANLVAAKPQVDKWAEQAEPLLARVAWSTGTVGLREWSESAGDDLDRLSSAAWLAQGIDISPSLNAAHALFADDRAEAALQTLCVGLGAIDDSYKDKRIASLGKPWKDSGLDVPFAFKPAANAIFESLQKGDAVRAERIGRWVVALDGNNGEAHRNLGLAQAMQGKATCALAHLVRTSRDQATQMLSGTMYHAGKIPEAMAVLDYASRWYNRAEQWLTFGGIAFGAMDNPRTVHAYALAYTLDPAAFDASMLNAYAGVLDEVGDYETCERISEHLLRLGGDDPTWKSNGSHNLACAYLGLGRFAEAEAAATVAVTLNPLPDNAATFAGTLAKAKAKQQSVPPAAATTVTASEPVFTLIKDGDAPGAAACISDESWRVKRAALRASRYRFGSESRVPVTQRASDAAGRILAESAGHDDLDAALARSFALELRAQASFPREPIPSLGDRMTREAFYQEFRARGGVVIGDAPDTSLAFVDREVLPGTPVATAAAYVALLHDLARLTPTEALAKHHLDVPTYLEVAKTWTAAFDADPTLQKTIEAGLSG